MRDQRLATLRSNRGGNAMRRVLLCAVVLSVALGSPAVAEPKPAPDAPAARGADRGGWPDTRVGELARGWVAAFSSGETAMKEYLATHLAATSLASKGVPQRVERYRDLR